MGARAVWSAAAMPGAEGVVHHFTFNPRLVENRMVGKQRACTWRGDFAFSSLTSALVAARSLSHLPRNTSSRRLNGRVSPATNNCCFVWRRGCCRERARACPTSLLRACLFLGESAGDAKARALLMTPRRSRWNCLRSKHLQAVRINKWTKFARHHKSWGVALRWLTEFQRFAKAMCSANNVQYHPVQMRADDVLCCMFLTEVAEQLKGVPRVVAARRALSRQRLREGASSLNSVDDPSGWGAPVTTENQAPGRVARRQRRIPHG